MQEVEWTNAVGTKFKAVKIVVTTEMVTTDTLRTPINKLRDEGFLAKRVIGGWSAVARLRELYAACSSEGFIYLDRGRIAIVHDDRITDTLYIIYEEMTPEERHAEEFDGLDELP